MPTDGQQVSETAKCKLGDVAICDCGLTISMGPKGWTHEDSDQRSRERAEPAEPVAMPPAPPETPTAILGRVMAYLGSQSPMGWDAMELVNKAWGSCCKDASTASRASRTEIPADLKADYRDCANWHNGSYIKGLIERIAALEGKRA